MRRFFLIMFFIVCVSVMCAKTALCQTAEEVLLRTKDGVEIHGVLIQVPEPKGTVVLLHSLDGKKEDWMDLSMFLNERGWNTLRFDFRGHGESLRQNKEVITWRDFSKRDYYAMIRDIRTVCQFLAKEGIPATALIGKSIGANLAVVYASRDPSIKGLILHTPGLSYRGVRCERPLYQYGERPILIVSPQYDKHSYDTAVYLKRIARGPAHIKGLARSKSGKILEGQEEQLYEVIAEWLNRVHSNVDDLEFFEEWQEENIELIEEKAMPDDIVIDFRK